MSIAACAVQRRRVAAPSIKKAPPGSRARSRPSATTCRDLPIALAVLIAEGVIPPDALADLLVLGELGQGGTVRSIRSALASAMLASAIGMRGIVIPDPCGPEAEVVDGIMVHAVRHLGEIIAALRGEQALHPRIPVRASPPRDTAIDMAEVRGQNLARAAIEVAGAGGHNVLLAGPPGTGKSMISRLISSIIPEMTRAEALETIKIYSPWASPQASSTAGRFAPRITRSPAPR